MPRQAGESQEVNNIYISQISGGTGGPGGSGGQEGGGGGVGEGPNFQAATIHLAILNQLPDARLRLRSEADGSGGPSREFADSVTNVTEATSTPHELSSRSSPSLAGFNGENPASGRVSLLRQPMLALRRATRFLAPRARSSVSANHGPPSSESRFPQSINQAGGGDFSTRPQSHQLNQSTNQSFSAFERQHLHEPLRSIHGGTFITADTVNHRQGETGINILHHSVALEALYDSADSFPQPRCHPETRTKMLEDLYNWAIEEESDSAQPICWLHGPAGAGKSAIMQTLCQRLQDARRLGGTFFFKRDHPTRGNPEVLFATLAYQLAEHNRDLRSLISQIVEDNPSLVARHMKVQLYKLIVEPCHLLIDSPPLILLIDGLDECETQDLQVEILRLVGSAVQHHPKTFQFLIASRPEAHIRETFNDPSFNGILDSVNVEKSFEDIRRYFADEFTRIHREHRDTMGSIPTPWPSPKVVDSLVWKSSGYFIYASTVIRFIDDKLSRLTERLAVIQSLTPTDAEAPFAALDQLYIQILSRVPIRFHFTLLDILQCMIVSESMRNPLQIDRLLELPSGETQLILRGLHSVLEIKKTRRLSVHHASFLEFLKDPQRSLHFHIKLENRMSVARAFLKGLSDDSHWHANSCNLSISDFEKCIVSVPPSIELVPLIRRFNPDFIWCQRWEDFHTFYSEIDEILTWLKAIQPVPEDLIWCLQGHQYLLLWDGLRWMCSSGSHIIQLLLSSGTLRVLRNRMCSLSLVSLEDFQQLMSRSPECVQILQASWLIHIHFGDPLPVIYYTRLLLNLSWDQVMAAHSAWYSFIGGRTIKQLFTGSTAIFALSLELCDIGKAISDLAQGFIGLIQRVGTGDVPLHICSDIFEHRWGELIRCSPHSSPELLHELYQFVPPWDSFPSSSYEDCLCSVEFYDVVQWLKEHPNPPLDLIERWQNYLAKSEDICTHCDEWDPYEKRWQKRANFSVVDLNKTHVPLDEEEIVRAWEDELETAILDGGYEDVEWIL